MPAEWEPTDEHRAYAAEHRIDLAHETQRFRQHVWRDPRRATPHEEFSRWLSNGNAKPLAPKRAVNGSPYVTAEEMLALAEQRKREASHGHS